MNINKHKKQNLEFYRVNTNLYILDNMSCKIEP